MTRPEFDPSAPGPVRLAVNLLILASVLETIATFWSRWPNAHGVLELWRAVVSPLVWLSISLAFAWGLARLTTWVYRLAVTLWVPVILIGTIAMILVATVRGPASSTSLDATQKLYVAVCCLDVLAALLLLSKKNRRAFHEGVTEGRGRVT